MSPPIAPAPRAPAASEGPLPSLLVLLTVVTGVVDAVSYVALGHVFVANMTGNVVFLGFALAGAPGLSVAASLIALAAFLAGAAGGGRLGVVLGDHRGRHLRTATGLMTAITLCAVIVAAIAGRPVPSGGRYALIVLLALAMGTQNATARRLAVRDLTTTVLTLTLTGIAADSPLGSPAPGHLPRRLISLTAMFSGALVSAVLVIHVGLVLPLAIAAGLMALTAVSAHRASRSGQTPDWAHPAGGKG
jgi:uncharacterized membrane protein YoaK (UPF0700 family)